MPKQSKEQKKDAQNEQINIERAITSVMSTEEGRLFVNWMIAQTYPLSSSAAKAGFKTNETMFFEGCRNVGIRQIAEISRICPGSYLKMNQENNQ